MDGREVVVAKYKKEHEKPITTAKASHRGDKVKLPEGQGAAV